MRKRKKLAGLEKRWLLNNVSIMIALALVCVAAITISISVYYYSNIRSSLENKARTTTDFFGNYISQSYNEYYQSCIQYAMTFEARNQIELQFINKQGKIVASSYGPWAGESPTTPDIADAMESRGISRFMGKDPYTGERIMAVSSPMIYTNGEVIGVLRYVTSIRLVDRQIFWIMCTCLGALALIVAIVIVFANLIIRSIMKQVEEITEKARRIANGSYGVQIQTPYRDEIGELASTINEMSAKISENEKIFLIFADF